MSNAGKVEVIIKMNGVPEMNYKEIFEYVTNDERYMRNLDWGRPRKGHPEGTVRAHIAELEKNLKRINPDTSSDEHWKLKILIHVHDSFKAEAIPDVPIINSKSHASIAAAFLRNHCSDADLVNMVQYHDEPYALWRQTRQKGAYNKERLKILISKIQDWRLFLTFNAIDGVTAGKSIEPLQWAAAEIGSAVGLEEEARDVIAVIVRESL
jgi:hypothetical protein